MAKRKDKGSGIVVIPKLLKCAPMFNFIPFPRDLVTVMHFPPGSVFDAVSGDIYAAAMPVIVGNENLYQKGSICTLMVVEEIHSGRSPHMLCRFLYRIRVTDYIFESLPDGKPILKCGWEGVPDDPIAQDKWIAEGYPDKAKDLAEIFSVFWGKVIRVGEEMGLLEGIRAEALMQKGAQLQSDLFNPRPEVYGMLVDDTAAFMYECYGVLLGGEDISQDFLLDLYDVFIAISILQRAEKLSGMLKFFTGSFEEIFDGKYVSEDIPMNKEDAHPGRRLIQEELNKPREARPRFSLKQPVFRDPPSDIIRLSPERSSKFIKGVISFLDEYVVGQYRAKRHIAEKLVGIRQGLNDPLRPVIGGFFPGPTGVGKTELIKALAKFLFDDFSGYTHIACNLLQRDHETSYIIGAPPGYIGHDQEPILSQWRIDRPHFFKVVKDKLGSDAERHVKEVESLEEGYMRSSGEEQERNKKKIRQKDREIRDLMKKLGYTPGQFTSIILFDEAERAHPKLFDTLLQVLDDGKLPLLTGAITHFTNSLIFWTSNIYGTEIMREISGRGKIGFQKLRDASSLREEFETRIWKETLGAVEKHFSFNPAFLGRLGKENINVFHPLSESETLEILDRMYFLEFLERVQNQAGIEELYLSDKAKRYLYNESQDPTNRALGARSLKRVFERRVEDKIKILLDQGEEEGGIVRGDRIWIDAHILPDNKEELTFDKAPKGS